MMTSSVSHLDVVRGWPDTPSFRDLHDSIGVLLCANYFLSGPPDVDPGFYQAEIAASDINGDGVPLSVADYVSLFREQIRRDTVFDHPRDTVRVGRSKGFFKLAASTDTHFVAVRAKTADPLGGALLIFRYRDTEIDNVMLTGRASKMTVEYCKNNGELRVLITAPQETDAPSPVSGEILRILPYPNEGAIELLSVDAATYDCRIIEPEFGETKLNLSVLSDP